MILLSESAKEKLERERFMVMKSRSFGMLHFLAGRQLGRTSLFLKMMGEEGSAAPIWVKNWKYRSSLKKTFKRDEAAKACRMAIDVISDEWLDKQFGGAA